MSYPRIIARVYREPWCVLPSTHAAIRAALTSRLAGEPTAQVFAESIDIDEEEVKEDGIEYGTAIIPVYGILGQHLSSLETMCGGVSVDALRSEITLAMEDDDVRRILLDFDSPGGVVTGIPELAKFIAECDKMKPVYAYTEATMASAAYWLASQARKIFATSSADVGSIGVYAVYLDETEALEQEGVKVNAISAGTYKLTGAPFKPMTEDEREMLQEQVDWVYSQFKASILSKREVPESAMQGQVFDGAHAVSQGLIDGVVDSVNDVTTLLAL